MTLSVMEKLVSTRRIELLNGAADPATGVTHQPPGQLQLEQRQLHRRSAIAALPDQLVDPDRRGSQQTFNVSRSMPEIIGQWIERGGLFTKGRARLAVEPTDQLDHIGGRLDQHRAFADQLVAALRTRIERRSWHCHHLAPSLARQPRGNQ